jgi:nitric oxide reductase large subunit
MKKIFLVAAILGMAFTAIDSNAQAVHRGDRRVVSGAHNGQLTAMEVRQINMKKKDLQRRIRMARMDGIVTYREQRMIDMKKRELDRMIFMQKNDWQTRR